MLSLLQTPTLSTGPVPLRIDSSMTKRQRNNADPVRRPTTATAVATWRTTRAHAPSCAGWPRARDTIVAVLVRPSTCTRDGRALPALGAGASSSRAYVRGARRLGSATATASAASSWWRCRAAAHLQAMHNDERFQAPSARRSSVEHRALPTRARVMPRRGPRPQPRCRRPEAFRCHRQPRSPHLPHRHAGDAAAPSRRGARHRRAADRHAIGGGVS